jgi:hypothetical protein
VADAFGLFSVGARRQVAQRQAESVAAEVLVDASAAEDGDGGLVPFEFGEEAM